MARQERKTWGRLGALVAILAIVGPPAVADAAYRLTFQNGTSIEVQGYEDLGDDIRYPRLGGVVVVPKSTVSAIEEAVHLPSPSTLPTPSRAGSQEARGGDRIADWVPALPQLTLPSVQIPAFQGTRAREAILDAQSLRVLTGAALLVAFVGIVAFFLSDTWSRSKGRADRGAGAWRAARRGAGRPLGVVLVGISDVIFGLMTLSAGLAGVVAGQVIADLPVFLIPADAPIVLIVVSLAAVAFGAVLLATAYGMWSLQAWGWRLQVVVCFVDILLNAYTLLANPPSAGSLFSAIGLFVDSAILLYVGRPPLRARFTDLEWEIEEQDDLPQDPASHTPSL